MRVVTRPIDPVEDPLRRGPTLVWMSPVTSLWGWGEVARFHLGSDTDRFSMARRRLEELADGCRSVQSVGAPVGPVAMASMTFASGSAGSVMVVPEVMVCRRGDLWWEISIDGATPPPVSPGPEPPTDRARFAGSSVPDVMWLEAVAEATHEIRRSELSKVVLARDYALWSRHPFHPPRLLRRLADRFPECHTFSVAGLVGASPELLIGRRGRSIDSVVLAGSAPAYDDPEDDRLAATALTTSAKDRWEHDLAVDSVRDALTEVASSLTFPTEPRLLRLANVQHLATHVSGTLATPVHVLDLVERLHPTAAVGGTPTDLAMDAIARLEGMDRGRYAGPVGWVDGTGDGEFAIALRCAELSGARARLFAGAGIVDGSLPEAELEETRIKLQAMTEALGGG